MDSRHMNRQINILAAFPRSRTSPRNPPGTTRRAATLAVRIAAPRRFAAPAPLLTNLPRVSPFLFARARRHAHRPDSNDDHYVSLWQVFHQERLEGCAQVVVFVPKISAALASVSARVCLCALSSLMFCKNCEKFS